ncbi:hypothetical protein HMPREF9075_02265 [Capnocytophaga sp. oral taxon 332 str. F0381]|uniref:SUKH-4 family immunity protein n=1 Tax=Capnocytophaga sp. oral taxon 332 TaxID=712213 RepID=UPI0002A1F38F|nr:SUKH-4 family immunity protein [Capnocytophaga sp. oral taxon 332]EKY06733.1 hypothetical protein HMPREF9075_02265 [Capnocytophaga sp. oral taxon 332 str. F0381]
MDKIEILNILHNNINLSFLGISFYDYTHEKIIDGRTFYIIGSDYEDELGINVETGNIYTISLEELTFVNSSLEQFIKCIKTVKRIVIFEEDFKEEKRHKQVEFLRNQFLKIDKECVSMNNWWYYILEQIEEGLL